MKTLNTLQELVKYDSESGHEAAIAAHIAERCIGYGLEVNKIDGNIIAHFPGKDRSKAFILNGHMDTVPPVEGWQTDPFTLTQDTNNQDIFYGLGASDMKSGLSIMLDIAATTASTPPPYDLWFIFTRQEETDTAGAKTTAQWFADHQQQNYTTIGGLILEPTEARFVGAGHRNGLKLDVTAEGTGGHGSYEYPARLTAIGKLSRFIANIEQINESWKKAYPHELLGTPTINPTNMTAGNGKHNIVPTTATAEFDLRTTPALVDALPQVIAKLEEEYDLSIVSPWEPANTVCSPDTYIYQSVQEALPTVPIKGFSGATDLMAFLEHDIPLLIYGPGTEEAMHKANEYVRASAIKLAHETIRRVMQHY